MSDRPPESNDEFEPADDTEQIDGRDTTDDNDDTAMTDDPISDNPASDDPTASTRDSRFTGLTAADFRAVLDRVALALLALLALVASWSFYVNAETAIELWVDDAYQPFALAAFNLAVLLAALAGIAHQLGRLRHEGHSASAE